MTSPSPQIEGAKSKSGGRAPVESRDTLRSKQWAEIVDLVSEGEIVGLVDGLRSVYLDDTPIQNADGSMNFVVDAFATTVGTQGQPAIAGFDSAQSEVGVGIRVTASTPVVRTVLAGTASAVRLTLAIPELTQQSTTTGDLSGSSVTVAVDVQTTSGGYVERWRRQIDGKTVTRYQFAVLVPLTGNGPWDIRVRRITADSTSVTLRNETWWDSYTLVSQARLRYPNSALAALRVDAEHHQRIPRRAYHMRGRIIRVPSNYDPVSRRYTGIWDGLFKLAYSNCPPWVFFDMATHPRYGLGRRQIVPTFNKWQLYAIGRYCDAVDAGGQFVGVPNGRGGVEPRFTCNAYLQTPEEAYKVLQDLASLFRALLTYTGGSVSLMQDAPDDAYCLFVPANVVDGVFRYEGSSRAVKKSGAVVWWNNPENMFRREPEFFQDPELVTRYGVENIELSPIGVTSRGQALRQAAWAVYTEAHEGETVSFTVGGLGACVPLGRVFRIADPSVSGEQLGGLVSAATAQQVSLDRPVTLRAGEAYTLHVMVPDTTQEMGLRTLSRAVTTGAGTTQRVSLASALDVVPPAQSVWVLESSAVAPTTWRCIRVAQSKTPGMYEIAAVAHSPGKFGLIERGIPLDSRPVSRMRTDAPVALGPLSLRETVYRVSGVPTSRVTVGWVPAAPGMHYRVSWRLSSGPWTQMPLVGGQSVDIDAVSPGQLDVTVRTVNPLGVESGITLDGMLLVTGDPATPWGDPTGNLAPNTEFLAGSTAGWQIGGWVAGRPLLFGGLERTRDPATPWIPVGVDAICIGQSAPNAATDQLIWGGPAGTSDTSIVGVAYTDELIPIEPLRRYIVSGWCAGHGCRVGLHLEFMRVDGTPASAGGGAAWTPGPLGAGPALGTGWQRLRVASDAPADAAYIRLLVAKGNGSVGSSHAWMLRPQIQAGTTTQTEPGDYVPGVPRDVRQLGYEGDIDATRGAPAGTAVAGRDAGQVLQDVDAAAVSAQQARAQAQQALAQLQAMSSDGVLSRADKPPVRRDWLAIDAERAGIVASASTYGVSVSAYVGAITALGSYLGSLSPAWDDTSQDTTIVPAVFDQHWLTVYRERQAVLDAIDAQTGQRAVWASVSGAGRPEDNATRGAAFGVNIGGQMTEATAPTYAAPNTFTEGAGLTLATALASGAATPMIAVSSPTGSVVAVVTGVLRIGDEPSSSASATAGTVRLAVNGMGVNTLPIFPGKTGQSGNTDVPFSLAWHGAVGGVAQVQAVALKTSGAQAVSLLPGTTVYANAMKR